MTTTHAGRLSKKLGLVRVGDRGPRSAVDLDELADIRHRGALSRLESVLRGDLPRLDAWRVRIACACIMRVSSSRGMPVAREILQRWPFPVKLALAYPNVVKRMLEPVGLTDFRANLIHHASVVAAHGDVKSDKDTIYAVDAVRLLIDRDLSKVPRDKTLRAIRERMFRDRQIVLVTSVAYPDENGNYPDDDVSYIG